MRKKKEGNWIYIPELQVYVEKELHHRNYSYDQLKEIYGKDFEKMLLTRSQVEVLDASKTYRKIFKMRTWNNDFYIQQYNKQNKKKGYTAVFFSNGSGSGCYSGRGSNCAGPYRGVRFKSRMIKEKTK